MWRCNEILRNLDIMFRTPPKTMVGSALSVLDTANYNKLLQSGLQVHYKNICFLLFMLEAFSLMFLTCIYLRSN